MRRALLVLALLGPIPGALFGQAGNAGYGGNGGGSGGGSYTFNAPLSLVGSTVSLGASGVTSGAYTCLNATINTYGVITTASNGSCAGGGTVTHTVGALTLGQLVIGNGAADLKVGDLSGDVTTAGSTATTLATVNASPGSYGSASIIPVLTIDAKGRITAVSTASANGAAWGSISGTLASQTDLQTALNAKQNTISVLPVANGGNGTATPALTAGANITLTGAWPNYTIASNGGSGAVWGTITGTLASQTDLQTALNAKQNTISVLPVANGGNGTATPSLVAGSNVTISGTWPNQVVNASNNAAAWGSITGSLASQTDLQTALNAKEGTITVLPVAKGGNGTATPTLTAGSNVTISGTWPNYTIAATGGGGAGGSGVPAGSALPGTCTPGTDTLYLKTSGAVNQQLYSCTATNTWTLAELLGASGALSVDATTGALDIVTSVVPRMNMANVFTGRNGFAVNDFTTQAAPAAPAAGKLSLYANTDGSFHVINSAGVDAVIGSGGGGGSTYYQVGAIGGAPTCNSSTRGYHYFGQGGAGVSDTEQVCRKDGADSYSWLTIY